MAEDTNSTISPKTVKIKLDDGNEYTLKRPSLLDMVKAGIDIENMQTGGLKVYSFPSSSLILTVFGEIVEFVSSAIHLLRYFGSYRFRNLPLNSTLFFNKPKFVIEEFEVKVLIPYRPYKTIIEFDRNLVNAYVHFNSIFILFLYYFKSYC